VKLVSVRVVDVVGAPPNFVKLAPVIDTLGQRDDVEQLIVHIGQHYDAPLFEEISRTSSFPSRTGSWASDPVRTVRALGRPRWAAGRRRSDGDYSKGPSAAA
jgi:hypothetical protein